MSDFVEDYVTGIRRCLSEINKTEVETVVEAIFDAYKQHRHVFVFGNGGSATTATHFACDLAKGTIVDGKERLSAISLTDNIALMTAIANDISYSSVFKEQLINLLNKGDVVIGISASGNSPNVLEAIGYAKAKGAMTVGICGFGGGKLSTLADKAIIFSARDYRQVEDAQMILTHLISLGVRQRIEVNSE